MQQFYLPIAISITLKVKVADLKESKSVKRKAFYVFELLLHFLKEFDITSNSTN